MTRLEGKDSWMTISDGSMFIPKQDIYITPSFPQGSGIIVEVGAEGL